MPPDGSAGKNFSTGKPRAASAIASDTVAQPGSAGTGASASACARSGGVPGLTRKSAPASTACVTSSGLMTVPTPTMMSGTSAMMARTASSAAGVRSVISTTLQAAGQQRARQRNGVGGALDRHHRDDRDREQRGRIGQQHRALFGASSRSAARPGMRSPQVACAKKARSRRYRVRLRQSDHNTRAHARNVTPPAPPPACDAGIRDQQARGSARTGMPRPSHRRARPRA